jgi:hypothetical protein
LALILVSICPDIQTGRSLRCDMDFRLNADTDASGNLMQLPTIPLPKPGTIRNNPILCDPEEDTNCVDPLFRQMILSTRLQQIERRRQLLT